MKFLKSVWALYSAVIILTLTTVGGYYLEHEISSMYSRHLDIRIGIEKIVRLDLELTDMLYMDVSSRRTEHASVYNETLSELDGILEKVLSIAGNIEAKDEIASVMAANSKLVDMEKEALSRMTENRWEEAELILFGDGYKKNKGIYAAGSQKAVDLILKEIGHREDSFRNIQEAALGIRFCALLLLIWVGILFSRRTRSDMSEQLRLRRELELINNDLEKRISDRTEELGKMSVQAQNRAVFEKAQSVLASALHGEITIEGVAEKSLEKITGYLKIPMAAIFVDKGGNDKTVYSRMAAYSYEKIQNGHDSFDPDEGLVGRAAVAGRIVATPLPSGERQLEAGFGGIPMKVVYHVPSGFKGKVLAVFELVSDHFLSGDELEWLEKAAVNTGAAIMAAIDAERLKAAFDRLSVSEARTRHILDALGEGVYGIDNNGIITFCNRSALKLLGYSCSEEVLGRENHSLFHYKKSDGSFFPVEECPMLEAVRKGVSVRLQDDVFWRSDGTSFPVDATCTPMIRNNGDISGAVIAFSDITDRKRMDEAIREHLGRMRIILGNSPAAVLITSVDGIQTFSNHRLAELLGFPDDDVETIRLSDIFVHDEERYRLIEELEEKGMVRDFESLCARSDGSSVSVLITACWLDMQDEQVLVSWFYDISERKQAEEAMREARDMAEKASRAKADFLANMSHEIRSPMNAIIGMNHLLMKTGLTERQRDYAEKIQRSSRSLLGVINDILDFSKIEAGKLVIENIDFDLDEVLNNLSTLITARAHEKGLEVVFAVDHDVPMALAGDPLRLGQILMNLAGNAVKFTESGDIVISISTVRVSEEDAVIRFEVKDTGIGLTEEQRLNLFQSFHQADTSTTRRYGGTGLGLTISRQLVGMMGGEIGVVSVFGRGSTFWFTARFGIHEKGLAKTGIIPESLRDMKVLVVDDSMAFSEAMKGYLEDFTFNVDTASSGDEAVRLVKRLSDSDRKNYDLVFMDWKMPGLNGIEASRKIRQETGNSCSPKIIMVTGYAREDIMEQADRTGLDGFLLKPVTPSMLFDAVMDAFGHDSGKRGDKNIDESVIPEGFEAVRGSRILVVEDNDINQQLAKELLEDEGFIVIVSENGEEAVKTVTESDESFDAVLMDLQMPVMDGYTAAEEIRKLETGRDSSGACERIPIIAMTADAMQGVREKVIAAGMDDYITKPVDPSEVFNVLFKWIKPGDRKLPDSFTAGKKESKPDSRVNDLPAFDNIDSERGLARVSGNRDLYLKLLLRFYEENGCIAETVRENIKNDHDRAFILVHTLKGLSGTIGASGLMASAGLLESALRENRTESLEECLKNFEDSLDRVLSELGTYFSVSDDQSVSPDNSQTVSESAQEIQNFVGLLKELLPCVHKRQAAVIKNMMNNIKAVSWSREISERISEIDIFIGRYKYMDAHECIEKTIDYYSLK